MKALFLKALSVFLTVCRALWQATYVVIRTLNLWEPETFDHEGKYYPAISISKLAMWASFILVFCIFSTDAGMATEIISGLMAAGATGNYAYRRHVQARTRTAGYRDWSYPEERGLEDAEDTVEEFEPEP